MIKCEYSAHWRFQSTCNWTKRIDPAAILALKERKGSSRQAIKKYILANFNVSARAHFDQQVSAAIKRGAAKNLFTLPKGTWRGRNMQFQVQQCNW